MPRLDWLSELSVEEQCALFSTFGALVGYFWLNLAPRRQGGGPALTGGARKKKGGKSSRSGARSSKKGGKPSVASPSPATEASIDTLHPILWPLHFIGYVAAGALTGVAVTPLVSQVLFGLNEAQVDRFRMVAFAIGLSWELLLRAIRQWIQRIVGVVLDEDEKGPS